jgi:hypothetical protein
LPGLPYGYSNNFFNNDVTIHKPISDDFLKCLAYLIFSFD